MPQLLSQIQVLVDQNRSNGQFILTGSHQPKLKEGIAQSLAGRTALLTLYPLSISELESAGINLTRDEYILKGFLPSVYDRNQDPVEVYDAYYRTNLRGNLPAKWKERKIYLITDRIHLGLQIFGAFDIMFAHREK